MYSLAIFFWIMRIPLVTAQVLVAGLLFSFELCGGKCYVYDVARFCLPLAIFFWIMLKTFLLTGEVPPEVTCYFLLNYAPVRIVELTPGVCAKPLLFSFELCCSICCARLRGDEYLLFSFELCLPSIAICKEYCYASVDLLFSFELCRGLVYAEPETPKQALTCYFLLNYAHLHSLASQHIRTLFSRDLLFSFELCPSHRIHSLCRSLSYLLFSFELCGLNAQHNARVTRDQPSLLFSFELCEDVDSGTITLEVWDALLFSFELCDGVLEFRRTWRKFVVLLFSFELCPHILLLGLYGLLPEELAIFFWIMHIVALLRVSEWDVRVLAIFFWIMLVHDELQGFHLPEKKPCYFLLNYASRSFSTRVRGTLSQLAIFFWIMLTGGL